jgi:hypothetical protein
MTELPPPRRGRPKGHNICPRCIIKYTRDSAYVVHQRQPNKGYCKGCHNEYYRELRLRKLLVASYETDVLCPCQRDDKMSNLDLCHRCLVESGRQRPSPDLVHDGFYDAPGQYEPVLPWVREQYKWWPAPQTPAHVYERTETPWYKEPDPLPGDSIAEAFGIPRVGPPTPNSPTETW